jgi:hypothetical protein
VEAARVNVPRSGKAANAVRRSFVRSANGQKWKIGGTAKRQMRVEESD